MIYTLEQYQRGELPPIPIERQSPALHVPIPERTAAEFARLCLCVIEHAPPPLELHLHHVWPLGMGGPDVASNRVLVCPNTHYTAHVLLRSLVRTGGRLDGPLSRRSGRRARELALIGWARYSEHLLGLGAPLPLSP